MFMLAGAANVGEATAEAKVAAYLGAGLALAVLAAAGWGLYRLRVRQAEPDR
jgi:hypothetical protein